MRENYGLDRLIAYDTESIPDTVKVVNPAYCELDGKIRRLASLIGRKLTELGGMTLEENIDSRFIIEYQHEKAELFEEIEHLQKECSTLKAKRKSTDRHIAVSQLPKEQQFKQLGTSLHRSREMNGVCS